MILYTSGGLVKASGLWFMPEYLLKAAVHRVHLYAVVPGARVPPHRRLLHLQDGHVECRMCLL